MLIRPSWKEFWDVWVTGGLRGKEKLKIRKGHRGSGIVARIQAILQQQRMPRRKALKIQERNRKTIEFYNRFSDRLNKKVVWKQSNGRRRNPMTCGVPL